MTLLFSPPIAFLIYALLVAGLALIGWLLAGGNSAPDSTTYGSSLYASGEAPPADDDRSVPGYRPFFLIALFFATLHLGVVILATSSGSPMALVFLFGLFVSLIALILG
ncbi:MAG: hypothetical protein CL607_28410 [Anaerolineaceae bacterium]|nr:hypothetical protein [Anaerolineaceae bacterium]